MIKKFKKIAAFFLVFGLFIDAIPAIIILGTVLYPVASAAEIHPVFLPSSELNRSRLGW